jgi:MFS transporter, FSR family, fosmidomycin resistance protein
MQHARMEDDFSDSRDTTARSRSLIGACLAHVLHDGYTDQLYALLPIWQSEFGLSYAGLAVVRALYYGTMGTLQVPGDRLIGKLGPHIALSLATLIAALGYMLMALPFGFAALCIGLVIAGMGSSVQHPRASALVAETFGKAARGPLGIYNFAGDLGKSVFPAVVALLLPSFTWRSVVGLMSIVGLVTAAALMIVLPRAAVSGPTNKPGKVSGNGSWGFPLLVTIGAFDTATRMGYLLFLPFLLHGKGADDTIVGTGLALLFIGGALGKACCGWLGEHIGVVWSVIVTEAATAVLIVATLSSPLVGTLTLLPFLGIVLNGTSSVLYGTVPDFAHRGDVGRAFAIFYTGVISSGGLSPIVYGAIADQSSRTVGVLAAALTAVAIIPMVVVLELYLRRVKVDESPAHELL